MLVVAMAGAMAVAMEVATAEAWGECLEF